MKDMLKCMVYYEFVKDKCVWLTQNGVTIWADEGGTVLSPEGSVRFAEKKWNESLDTAAAIQWYIFTYSPSNTDYEYPEYNGQEFKVKFSAIF